jgi:hypothetical protein
MQLQIGNGMYKSEERVKEPNHLWDIDFRVKLFFNLQVAREFILSPINYETAKDLELLKPGTAALQFMAHDLFRVIRTFFYTFVVLLLIVMRIIYLNYHFVRHPYRPRGLSNWVDRRMLKTTPTSQMSYAPHK